MPKLKKFRPNRAVGILANRPEYRETAFLHTWALAGLLAWAILDQRPGKRPPREARGGSKKKRKIRTANAKQAGQITLAYLLDRYLHRAQSDTEKDTETLQLMAILILSYGGFMSFFEGQQAKGLLDDIKKANRELGYVYRIVDFICRYNKWSGAAENDPNLTIESAKSFVEKWGHEGDASYGISKIAKIWEKYKSSAPYISQSIGFFRFGSRKRDQ